MNLTKAECIIQNNTIRFHLTTKYQNASRFEKQDLIGVFSLKIRADPRVFSVEIIGIGDLDMGIQIPVEYQTLPIVALTKIEF